MRMFLLALAAALICAALPAEAQDQPPAPIQTQVQPDASPAVVPNGVPKSEPNTSQPKSQDRVQDQPPPAEAKTPSAEASAPPKMPSRFTFKRVENSFLRLDSETGQVAYCSQHGSGWACEAVPEERARSTRKSPG